MRNSFVVRIDSISSVVRSRIHIGDMEIPIGATFRKQFYDVLEG